MSFLLLFLLLLYGSQKEEGAAAAAAAAVCQSLIDRTIEVWRAHQAEFVSVCLCVCVDTVVRLASTDGWERSKMTCPWLRSIKIKIASKYDFNLLPLHRSLVVDWWWGILLKEILLPPPLYFISEGLDGRKSVEQLKRSGRRRRRRRRRKKRRAKNNHATFKRVKGEGESLKKRPSYNRCV